MEDLNNEQQEKLQEFQAISNESNVLHAIRHLEAAEWDLQRAVQLLYEDAPHPKTPSQEKPSVSQAQESTSKSTAHSLPNARPSRLISIWDCLASPMRLTTNILWSVLSFSSTKQE